MPFSEWTDGSFVRLGYEIIGPWLGIWLIFSSALTNIGMFLAEMSSDAWMVAGMADRGIIPKVLGSRNQYGTPYIGIIASAIGIILLSFFSFIDIVEMLNMIFCAAQSIEFVAFLYLRAYRPDIPRPFKIPLSFPWLCLFISIPLGFIGVIVALGSANCLFVSSIVIICGIVLYYVIEHMRIHNGFEFEPLQLFGNRKSYMQVHDEESVVEMNSK